MVSFVQLSIFFLAGISLVASVPAGGLQITEDQDPINEEVGEDSTNTEEVDLNDPNAINVIDAVSSIAELSDDQREKLQKPLTQLIENFDGTLFASLFSYIRKRLQNPTEFEASEVNNAELFKKTPLALKSFISTLQKLSDKVINDSQPQFDEILNILGNAKFAVLFREILTTLQMRQALFEYAKMGDGMLMNLPNMLADASKFGIDNIQQLIQNPEAMAALTLNPGAIAALSQSPGVIAALNQNPGMIAALRQNPGVMAALNQNPVVKAALSQNPVVKAALSQKQGAMPALSQNQGALAALRPSAAGMQALKSIKVQVPKLSDILAPSSETTSTPHPLEIVNAAKNISDRVRLNTVSKTAVPRIGVPRAGVSRINSMQQQSQPNFTSFRPESLGSSSSMSV